MLPPYHSSLLPGNTCSSSSASYTQAISVTSSTGEEPAQEWTLQQNGSLRAYFLTAVTADAAVIPMCRLPGFITRVPINSFRLNWAHPDAGAAIGAFCLVDNRSLAYSILGEGLQSAAGARHWRSPNYVKSLIEELLNIFPDYFNVLDMVCSQTRLLSWP